MISWGVLPLLAATLIASLGWKAGGRDTFADIRLAWATGFLSIAGLVGLGTEVLSIFHLLSPTIVRLFWTSIVLASLAVCLGRWRTAKNFYVTTLRAVGSQRTAAIALGAIGAIMFACAVFSPPNNYDSLTYHVARVAHWAQEQSVAQYATGNLRQIEFAPLNSYFFLHLELLTGSDALFNLVQFSFLFGLLLPAASLIMSALGASARLRAVGLVAIAAMPAVILQAESTQNDLLEAAFVAAAIAFALSLRQQPAIRSACGFGLAVGAAILTKGTAFIFGAALAIWWLAIARPWREPALLRAAAIASTIALGMSAGFLVRNQRACGSVFGTFSSENHAGEVSVGSTISTLLKNAALQLQTRQPSINRLTERAVRGVHSLLLLPSPDDRRLNFAAERFWISDSYRKEDFAGNLILFGLLCATALTLPFRAWLRRNRAARASPSAGLHLGFALLGMILLFSCLTNWQSWGSRLVTPIFCLGVAWAAPQWRWLERASLARAAIVLFAVAGIPWLLRNETRPLVGANSVLTTPRDAQWLAAAASPELTAEYAALALYLQQQKVHAVALHWHVNTPEYAIVRHLRQHRDHPRFFHVAVENYSKQFAGTEPAPDLIIGRASSPPAFLLDGTRYVRAWAGATLAAYRPARVIPPPLDWEST